MRAFGIVLLILFIGSLAIVIVNDFKMMDRCHQAGGVYHKTQCLSPDSVIKT